MTVSNRLKLWLARRAGRPILVRTRREEGSSLIEFAMVVPVLSMFLVGIIYGGIAFYDYSVLANAVANGARTLAISRGAGASSPTNQNACQLAQAQVQATAYGLNQTNLPICSGPCGVGSPGVSLPTFTVSSGSGSAKSTCNALVQGEIGVVTATYPCSLYFTKLNINLCNVPGYPLITAQTTIRIE